MPFHEILKQTLSALWETKLRSFLTMFGIVWGITSVILLVGLGIGFNVDQKEHLRSIGTDIAIFLAERPAHRQADTPQAATFVSPSMTPSQSTSRPRWSKP